MVLFEKSNTKTVLVLALAGFGLLGCSNGTTMSVLTAPQTSDSAASEPIEPEGAAARDLDFVCVTGASTTHEEFDFSVVGPNELSDPNELREGGVAEGKIFNAIPTLDAAGATWRVSTSWGDTVVFFAAQ